MIEIRFTKDDGAVKKHTRPDTTFQEMETFKDMKEEIAKLQRKVTTLDRKEIADFDFRENERKQDEIVIDYLVELFKPHDSFTAEDFRNGIKSKDYQRTLNEIFRQIDPSIPDIDEDDKKKRNQSR